MGDASLEIMVLRASVNEGTHLFQKDTLGLILAVLNTMPGTIRCSIHIHGIELY